MDYWQRMPVHLIESRILVAGGSFQMKYQFEGGDEKCRCFFILKNPTADDNYLFMVTPTSEVQRRKDQFRSDEKALVVIKQSEYKPLDCVSLVDCGSPIYDVRKEDLISKVSKYEIRPLPQLPDFILQRLRDGVASSKRLTSNQKRLVLGETAAAPQGQ